VPPQSVALLTALFLRGPQTVGELRINSDRMHRFGDVLAVEGFLNELSEKPYVKELGKVPGARETRWAHLLSGEPAFTPSTAASSAEVVTVSELAAIRAEVETLKSTVARLCKELGIDP
jgi:uncharacterized protein YceH (UPF0502 family)